MLTQGKLAKEYKNLEFNHPPKDGAIKKVKKDDKTDKNQANVDNKDTKKKKDMNTTQIKVSLIKQKSENKSAAVSN